MPVVVASSAAWSAAAPLVPAAPVVPPVAGPPAAPVVPPVAGAPAAPVVPPVAGAPAAPVVPPVAGAPAAPVVPPVPVTETKVTAAVATAVLAVGEWLSLTVMVRFLVPTVSLE